MSNENTNQGNMIDGLNAEQIRNYLVANIIDEIVRLLIEEKGLTIEEALERVYKSETIRLLQISEGELYVQSPRYIYELMEQEVA